MLGHSDKVVLGEVRCDTVAKKGFHYFTDDAGQTDWPIVPSSGLATFLENRGDISSFPLEWDTAFFKRLAEDDAEGKG